MSLLRCCMMGRRGRSSTREAVSQHEDLRRRKVMKQAITSGVFAISFVSLLVLGLVSRVQARECSNASIKGTYGFSCEGTIVGVGPIAAIGVFTADGKGNGSEVETVSVNGEISRGEQGDAGDYAAAGLSSTSRSMSGYQRLKMAPNSPSSVFTRVCSNKCAPGLDHCICCFLEAFAHHLI